MRGMAKGRFEVVVYPKDLDSLELSLSRLGWEVAERFPTGSDGQVVSFRVPAADVRVELVSHGVARSLVENLGSDAVAGLRIEVDDADAAWSTARAAGLQLD